MLRSKIEILILFLILIFTGCTFQRKNPMDPDSDVSQNPPYNITITGGVNFLDYGNTVPLSVSAEDREGDAISFYWYSNGGTFSNTTGNTTIFTAGSTYGDYDIVCRATDSVGLYSEKTQRVHIGKSQSGILTSDEVWNGTHTLTGDILIQNGITLTISEGATITVSSNDILNIGGDPNRVEIVCYGNLAALGSEALPITILGSIDVPDCWGGITYHGTGINIDYVNVKNATTGFYSNKNISLSNLKFTKCETGMILKGNSGNISNLLFANCNIGMELINSSISISTTIFNNCYDGIIIDENSNSDMGSISNGNNSFICNNFNVINLSANNIFAKGNWWNTTDETIIDEKIYDDEEGGTGCVDYSGYLLSQP